MANKSTVAGDLRRFATFVKGLTDAADTLDQMQQIEEQANAATNQIEEAKTTLAGLQTQIADADRELVDVRAKVATSTRNAQAKAAGIEADAEAKAANIIEVARQAAQVQADALLAPAQAQRDALVEQITSFGDQLVRMRDDETALQAAIVTATDELAAVEGKLAAAREAVAKLLG